MRERIKVFTISVRQAEIVLSNGVLRMRIVTHQCRLSSRDIAIIITSISCCNMNSYLPTGSIYAFLLILRLHTDYFPNMLTHWVVHPMVDIYFQQTQHTFGNIITKFMHL